MRFRYYILMLSVLAASCKTVTRPIVTAKETGSKDVRSSIDSLNSHWEKALKNQDANTIAMLFDIDGAMLTSSGKVYRGREEIRKLMEKNFKLTGPIDAQFITENIWLEGNTAYETGEWRYIFLPNVHRRNRKEILKGHYLVIWQKQFGSGWKIIKDFGLRD